MEIDHASAKYLLQVRNHTDYVHKLLRCIDYNTDIIICISVSLLNVQIQCDISKAF